MPQKVTATARLLAALPLAMSLVAGAALPARAQIPTTDASVIPQLAQTAQTLSQQLAQVQQFQGQIQGAIRTLGGLGSLPQQMLGQLMAQLNPMSLLSGWSIPEQACILDSCGDFLRDSAFQGTGRTGVPQIPSSPDFGAQREYVESRFFSPTDLDVQGRQQILDERARAARAAARDAYAVALAARERIARAPQDAQRVVQVGSSGATMREDIQRLTAVLMAIYLERQQQLALYAALLEVEGSGAIAADPNVVSPRARPQGQVQRAATTRPTSAPARTSGTATAPAAPPATPEAGSPPATPEAGSPPAAPTLSAPPAPAPVAQTPAPTPTPEPRTTAGGAPRPGRLSGPIGPDTGMMDLPMIIAP